MGIIQKQGLFSALISYLGILVGFISTIWIQPNYLTAEEVGLTRLLFSTAFLVSMIIPLSAGSITSRYFPKFNNPSSGHGGFFGFIFIFPVVGSVLIAIVLLLFGDQLKAMYEAESPLFVQYCRAVYPLTVCLGFIAVINAYLYSAFKPIFPSFFQEVYPRLAQIILILMYSWGLISLDYYILSFVLIYLIQFALILIYAFNYGGARFKFTKQLFKNVSISEMLKYGYMIFAASISSMAIKLFDSVILGQFLSLTMVGIYSIAAYIPIFIEAPVNALDKVANARIAYSWEKGDLKNIRLIYFQSARVLFVAGGILFLGVTLNADAAFTWLPAIYAKGIPVLEILSLSALFNLMTGSNTAIIFTSERFRSGAYALVGVALVNLILLYTLIPVLGLEGAAWATCLASLLYNAFKYAFIWYRFGMQPFDLKTVWIALSIACTYLIVKFIPIPNDAIPAILIRSTAIIALYSLFLWASGVWNELRTLLKSGLSGRNAAQ